jgi:electron transfer flavoprotein beta subunit
VHIIVCIKQTFDTEAKIILNEEGCIDDSAVKFIINPYDEYAVEEALRLTEKGGGKVAVVSASSKDPSQALRQCLAMGADQAFWLDCGELAGADGHVYAEALGEWIGSQNYDLVFCGKEAIDVGAAEVPARLAEILNLPQVTEVAKLSIEGERATVRRDIEGGSEVIEVPLPCVLSAQKGLNEPRYPSMRRVLQAKKMPIQRITLEALGLSREASQPFTHVEAYIIPPRRQAGKILRGRHEETVAQLLTTLKDEHKVI